MIPRFLPPLLLAACTAHTPLGAIQTCVNEALGTAVPPPRVEQITRAEMAERFGAGYDAWYRAGTVYVVERGVSASLLAHEAARHALASVGRVLDAESDRLARRKCG